MLIELYSYHKCRYSTISGSYFHINTRGDFSSGVVSIPQTSQGFTHNALKSVGVGELAENECKCLKMHSVVPHVCTPLPLNKVLLKVVQTCWSRWFPAWMALSNENQNVCVFLLSINICEVRTFWGSEIQFG